MGERFGSGRGQAEVEVSQQAKRAEGLGYLSQKVGQRRCAVTVPREAADGTSLSPRPERT